MSVWACAVVSHQTPMMPTGLPRQVPKVPSCASSPAAPDSQPRQVRTGPLGTTVFGGSGGFEVGLGGSTGGGTSAATRPISILPLDTTWATTSVTAYPAPSAAAAATRRVRSVGSAP